MRVIELSRTMPSLRELILQARQENVIVRTVEGEEFIFAEIDDFDREVELLRNSQAFMAFLNERSQQRGSTSLAEMRKEFDLN